MSIATNNVIAKIAAVVAGLSLVAMSFAYAAPAAKADTTSDLNAQIAALMAQIAALQASAGGSASASVTFSKDLTLGSSGADVTALQNWLISKGQTIAAGATGYFGAQTKAAVSAWQASAGISPAAGYFGPISRAKANAAGGVVTTPGTTPVTGLAGLGRLTNVSTSSLGDVTSDLKEGGATVAVLGVSADATDGDVAVQRVDTTLTIADSGGSANLNKYVKDVSVYLDGKKLATMDAADGDKNGRIWTFRFAGLNGIIKSGKTGELYVKVTPVSSVDSAEEDDVITVAFPTDGLRAVGSDGISETYITTFNQTFTIDSMTAGTLTVSAGSDNPKASQVAVSSSTTTGVKLLTFSLKGKNSDITVEDLVASFGTSDSLSDVISSVKLMKGTTVLKSKTVSSGTYGTITFDNLNEVISKDATENYWIAADLKGDAAYADGTTLIASTTTAGWDVSDADGASVTPSAAAVGYTQTLTATGISVVKGTWSAPTVQTGLAGGADIATFSMPFTVSAGDTAVYIVGTAAKGVANGAGVRYGTTTTSTSGATGEPTASLAVDGTVTGDSAGSYYLINPNTSRTFTLSVAITATSTGSTLAGFVGTIMNSIEYGATTSGDSYYTSNLDTFKTSDVYISDR